MTEPLTEPLIEPSAKQIINDYFSPKQILNYSFFLLVAVLTIPTFLILITWNSLPDDQLYPIKRGLERVALAFAGADFQTKSTLNSKLVARRFDEADTLLDRSSTVGLREFNLGVVIAKNDLLKAQQEVNKKENAQKQTKKFITQLKEHKKELEVRKKNLPYSPPQPSLSPYQPPQPSTSAYQPPPQPRQQEQLIVDEIEETQRKLDEIIKELEALKMQDQEETQEPPANQNIPIPDEPQSQVPDEPQTPQIQIQEPAVGQDAPLDSQNVPQTDEPQSQIPDEPQNMQMQSFDESQEQSESQDATTSGQ